MTSYSNYGTALAGYVVERVSGTPFDDYVDRHILEPLGMDHTTTRQVLPPPIADELSLGYVFEDGRFEAQPPEFIPGAAPAGSVSSTASDMARFMLAHLGHGAFGDARILREETSRRMQETLFRHDPRLNGFAHGFYEMSSHGERIIGHGGDTIWFHSQMALFPERGLGVFVSYNSARGAELSIAPFLRAFLDRYFKAAARFPASAGIEEADLARYAGSYRMNRMSYTTFEKVMGLFVSIRVRATPEGQLVVSSPLGTDRYVEVEPLDFVALDGSDRVLFRADDAGRITHLFVNSMPMMAMVRLSWWQSPGLHQLLLGIGALVSLAIAFSGMVRLVRTLAGRSSDTDPRPARRGRMLLTVTGILNTLFFVGLAVTMSDPMAAMTSSSLTGLAILLAFPFAAALLLVPVAFYAVSAWRHGFWTLAGRLRYSSACFALVLFAWSLSYWNLLGWRLASRRGAIEPGAGRAAQTKRRGDSVGEVAPSSFACEGLG